MKKKSLFAALALGLTAAAPFACAQNAPATPPPSDTPAAAPSDQAPPPRKGKGRRGGDPMTAVLAKVDNQTDDQKTKIAAIVQDFMGKNRDMRGDTTLSDDDRRAKMMANMKDEQGQIRALLTPDQQTQFDAAVAAMPRGRRGGGGGGGDAPPPAPPPTI